MNPFYLDPAANRVRSALWELREARRKPRGHRARISRPRCGLNSTHYQERFGVRGLTWATDVPKSPALHWIKRNAAAYGYVEYPF